MPEETDLVNLIIRVPPEWRTTLHTLMSEHGGKASDYIRRAIEDAVKTEFGVDLPGRVRPHGSRRDYEALHAEDN